ncbi:hypothetical protein M3182_07725 [Mesobacillus maritimus]|uniref:hypothetical protein n=1 Tax=Mesobacillus maritimus TaxID=1643336 RepID=UPI00203CE304|nr:hypothetical protein [Mesobacillus maritimus]MCM3585637.1 hypothetical protein [Mesobacillus maritimus]MCM3669109.1 hypothetical protein [Mesobacillus maritimus]
MSKQLRQGMEKAKQHYIEKIIRLGSSSYSHQELKSFSISDLQEILKQNRNH